MSKNTPEIRINGFEDSWKECKLTDLVNFFSGLTYTPNDVQESGTLVLRSSNVNNGEVVDADNVYVRSEVVNSENVKEGDIIVVVRNGSRSLIGKHAKIKCFMPNTVIGAFMTGIRSECPTFTNALLSTTHFDKEVSMNMGATINQITRYMFSKMEFNVPGLDEQKEIGYIFENLDNLITLHQQEYEKLVNNKKAMLEKMFPKEGCDVPEIRFKGFDEPWGKHRLVEIAKYRNGKAHENCIDENGKYVVVNSKFVSTNGKVQKFSNMPNEPLYKNEIAFVLSDVPNGRAIARTFLVDESEKYTLNQRIAGITPLENTYPYFLYILMNRHPYFLAFDDGAKQTNLTVQDVLDFEALYPEYEEQKKIGEYFAKLDEVIVKHQQELEKLKNIKAALLEKMFV